MFSILEQLFYLGTVLTCDVPRVLPHVSFHKCTTPEHSVVIVIVNIHTVIQFLLVMYPSTCHVSAHMCHLTCVLLLWHTLWSLFQTTYNLLCCCTVAPLYLFSTAISLFWVSNSDFCREEKRVCRVSFYQSETFRGPDYQFPG